MLSDVLNFILSSTRFELSVLTRTRWCRFPDSVHWKLENTQSICLDVLHSITAILQVTRYKQWNTTRTVLFCTLVTMILNVCKLHVCKLHSHCTGNPDRCPKRADKVRQVTNETWQIKWALYTLFHRSFFNSFSRSHTEDWQTESKLRDIVSSLYLCILQQKFNRHVLNLARGQKWRTIMSLHSIIAAVVIEFKQVTTDY